VGASYEALMVAHLHSLPRELRQVRSEVPVKVAQVVARALARDPTRRYADAAAFVVAYREAIGLMTVESPAGIEPTPTLGRGGVRRPTPVEAPAVPGEPSGAGRPDGHAEPAEDGAGRTKGERARTKRSWWPFGRRR